MTSAGRFPYESLDITDGRAVEAVLGRHQPDTVIHTAAMTNVNQSERENDACWKTNVDAVAGLVRNSEKMGFHLIQLSSDFVFDGTKGPYREEDPTCPVNDYGKSKEAAERIVQASRAPWTLVRTILVYGSIENTPEHRNVVLWAIRELSQGKKIRVVEDQYRMPTLAEDLAEGCLAAAMRRATGIYHISGKDLVSVLDLVKMTAEVFRLDTSLIEPVTTSSFAEIAPRPPRTGFILDKALRELGYRPHSLKEGLEIVRQHLCGR